VTGAAYLLRRYRGQAACTRRCCVLVMCPGHGSNMGCCLGSLFTMQVAEAVKEEEFSKRRLQGSRGADRGPRSTEG